MKQHYSEADLLETYYTQPGASMPVMMHLADCSECAARYERLERKVRGLAACERDRVGRIDDQPETFWSRQRIAVMRKIDRRRSFSIARVTRVAAAAVLVLVLGGVATLRVAESTSRQVDETAAITVPVEPATLDDSPWESEPLGEYQSMVAWESWVEGGDQSL